MRRSFATTNPYTATACNATSSETRPRGCLGARMAQDVSALRCADAALQKDKEVVLAAVAQNGYALQYADAALQKDKELVLAAVARHGSEIGRAHV